MTPDSPSQQVVKSSLVCLADKRGIRCALPPLNEEGNRGLSWTNNKHSRVAIDEGVKAPVIVDLSPDL